MARQAEVRVVYGAALAQGVALVAFPASSAILTSPQYYDLSNTAYGSLFLPQAVAAILAALSGANLIQRYGVRRAGRPCGQPHRNPGRNARPRRSFL